MRLSQVIELLGNSVLQVVNPGNVDPEFDHIESDSRGLKERNLFICIGYKFRFTPNCEGTSKRGSRFGPRKCPLKTRKW